MYIIVVRAGGVGGSVWLYSKVERLHYEGQRPVGGGGVAQRSCDDVIKPTFFFLTLLFADVWKNEEKKKKRTL